VQKLVAADPEVKWTSIESPLESLGIAIRLYIIGYRAPKASQASIHKQVPVRLKKYRTISRNVSTRTGTLRKAAQKEGSLIRQLLNILRHQMTI
jgi:hypothetical protein